MVAPLSLPSAGPTWTWKYCHTPRRLTVSVLCSPPSLPALMILLYWGPVVPKYPGKLHYVEVNVGTNHGTKDMYLEEFL